MIDISSRKAIRVFAICTVILWLSYTIYLPPFVPSPDIKGLVDKGYEAYHNLVDSGVSKQQLEKRILSEFYFSYVTMIILIATGVISGFLIYKYKRYGRILTIILCIVMLGQQVFTLLRYPEGLKVTYVSLLARTPLQVIHKSILAPLFFILSIVYLFKKPVIQKFT